MNSLYLARDSYILIPMIAKTILDQFLSRAKFDPFEVDYWGTRKRYGSGDGDPRFTLSLSEESVITDLVKRSDLGFGEAYMDGRLDVDNLGEFLRFTSHNQPGINSSLGKQIGHHFAKNVKRNQASQISSHYDLGNDFYALWLDDTMTYTCAYFKDITDTLEMAQRQKIDHVLRKLQLSQGQRFVDLGCGWGHLVVRAAKLYGAKGIGVTLSQEQYKYAVDLAKREGVSELATFKCMNYQDMKDYPEQFDRVVSVGMLEHVGRGNHRQYFEVVDHLLAPGGISVLHSITQQVEDDMPAWIDKYIFPGGYVPSLREIVQLLPEYDFHLTDYESLRFHCCLTLEEWHRRFDVTLDAVRKLGYDDRFIRMWRLYLLGSVAGFRYGGLDLSQWVFTKGLKNDLPLTRARLYD